MLRIKDLLSDKGRDVWSVHPEQSVFQAIKMMAEREVGALVVCNDENKLIGIISERDYARKVILKGKASIQTKVAEIMSQPVVTVAEEARIDECMDLMTRRKIRHLPVLDRSTLIGMISVGDIVKAIISEQSFTITQLERYVRGEEAGS
ncbi:MAG: CBS domain-containing protein [Patiriisocius sp.]|jgi:CBS domain-containing protein